MPDLSQAKGTVLIVEDDFLLRASAADMVRDFGWEVLEAADADEAISLLEGSQDISAVFTDIQMPGSIDGLRLANVIRDRWPPIALLITSGQVSLLAHDLPPGARFVPKPYLPHQLKTHLDVLLS